MAIQRTLWQPDTCNCAIEFEWDDTVPDTVRTHTPVKVHRRCLRHAAFVALDGHYSQLLDENPRKNKALARLQAIFPGQFDANTGQFLGSAYFDSGHTLHVAPISMSQSQKNGVQTWCDNNLGNGKVVIE